MTHRELAVGDQVRIVRLGMFHDHISRIEGITPKVEPGCWEYGVRVGIYNSIRIFQRDEIEPIELTFGIANRVRLRTNTDCEGVIEEVTGKGYVVAWDGWDRPAMDTRYASELERIDVDPEANANDAAVSAGLSGPPTVDGGSTGSATELATEESPVPSIEELVAEATTLTARAVLLLEQVSRRHATSTPN